jgi:hypothetical protein
MGSHFFFLLSATNCSRLQTSWIKQWQAEGTAKQQQQPLLSKPRPMMLDQASQVFSEALQCLHYLQVETSARSPKPCTHALVQ